MDVLDYRTGIEDYADPTRGRAGGWLSWAIYLGMSWTWCIGMFLPVILVRDYGIWAWVIFAIPNVVGAAAMGWVLKDRTSQSIVVAHGAAIKAFSLVTTTFQFYFALWMFELMGAGAAAFAMFVFAMLVLKASRRDDHAHGFAFIVLMGTLATVLFGGMQGLLRLPPPVPMKAATVMNLLALVPVSVFGFLLNPYLDATFHLARQRMPDHHARPAFTIGFGFFFFAMVIYTLFYAHLFRFGYGGSQRAGIIGYWVIQLGLTMGFHWYGVPHEGEREQRVARWMKIGLTFLLGSIAWSITLLGQNGVDGEIVYRCFMGFYGLIFPAYVWLCMLPGRGGLTPTRRQLMVLAGTVLAALPFFWLGFVEGKMLWLLLGITIVLAARTLIPKPQIPEVAEAM